MKEIKLLDRVWCTASAQQLYDMGYSDAERTFMLHTYGQVAHVTQDKFLVSYAMWCNYEEGYTPVAVILDKKYFKFADLDEDYIRESEEGAPHVNLVLDL